MRADARWFGAELSVHVISWLTMLEDLDAAYAFTTRILDHSVQAQTMGIFLAWMWLPEVLPFRRDPRFGDLVQRLGLIEYWQVHGPPDECDLVGGKLVVREEGPVRRVVEKPAPPRRS